MPPETRIGRLAGRQHGVVTRAQLAALGVTPQQTRSRVASGALIRVHRGVFRVGHAAPSIRATYLAAVLACGEGAVLYGLAAAHLHRLVKAPPSWPTVLCMTERRVVGVQTRRSRKPLVAEEVTTAYGIPVTGVPRTLVDLAPLLALDALARVCHEAGVLHRVTPAMVAPLAAGRPGAGPLRRVMTGDAKVELSKLETRFLDRLRAAALPLPHTNRKAGGRRVDCRWAQQRLTVELDSYAFHNSRHSWEQDREREREAYARGDAFRRYTWRDVTEAPAAMLRELSALLS